MLDFLMTCSDFKVANTCADRNFLDLEGCLLELTKIKKCCSSSSICSLPTLVGLAKDPTWQTVDSNMALQQLLVATPTWLCNSWWW